MDFRQRIVKTFYPVLKKALKSPSTAIVLTNKENKVALQSFYQLKVKLSSGNELLFEKFKGKKILIVNTASSCGFTPQFAMLQDLQNKYNDKLVVLGIPSNDFKEQEKGNDKEIEQFCQINYGVQFQLTTKLKVTKGPGQNPIHEWLSSASQNGWNNQDPTWNFSKYLIDENGKLVGFFASAIEPSDKSILDLIET